MSSRVVTAAAIAFLTLVPAAAAYSAPEATVMPGPVDRHTKADMARARYVVLRATDVYSNFTRDRSLEGAPTIAHCNGYPGNRTDITITGEARSVFRLRGYSIGSAVYWFKTWADADRYWATTVRPQYIRCRAAGLWLVDDATGKTVKPRIRQAAAIPLRPTGAEKAVAYRVIGGMPATPGNDAYDWIDTNVFVKVGRSIALLRTVWITHQCDCHHDLARLLAVRLGAAQ